MGQKVHPIGFRLGVTRTWDSRWYANKRDYSKLLHEDIHLRDYLKSKLYGAGISKIEIERAASKVKINVHTARPGIVIGKKGAGVEGLKADVQRLSKNEIFLNIIEVKKPESNATLIAENVAARLHAPRSASDPGRFIWPSAASFCGSAVAGSALPSRSCSRSTCPRPFSPYPWTRRG